MGINVLSLFDGISCGQVALERVGIEVDKYFASEINTKSIWITQKNYPKTIQIGDITKVKAKDLPEIDLLMGGSPCQGFSSSGNGLNFNDKRSKLFFEFVRLLKECKPKYFLLENVKMKREWLDIISKELNVKPIEINSSLVSAQNRPRIYWTNIPDVSQPKDKKIILDEILDKERERIDLVPYVKDKLRELIKKYGKIPNKFCPYNLSEIRYKSPSLTAQGNSQTKSSSVILYSGKDFSMLNVNEWERLQNLPRNYTKGVSISKRKSLIGDGWTINLIVHIFKKLKKEVAIPPITKVKGILATFI